MFVIDTPLALWDFSYFQMGKAGCLQGLVYGDLDEHPLACYPQAAVVLLFLAELQLKSPAPAHPANGL
jgi:hypothetical protein